MAAAAPPLRSFTRSVAQQLSLGARFVRAQRTVAAAAILPFSYLLIQLFTPSQMRIN
jgi:hypothetical protein